MRFCRFIASSRSLPNGLGAGALLVALSLALAASPAMAQPCTVDGDCDDGLECNGVETCNLGTNTCDPGTPQPDGSPCSNGDSCTFMDKCQGGVCIAGGGGDGDGDGVCEADDNCPGVANPGQQNLDQSDPEISDGLGDACDDVDRRLNIVVSKLQRNLLPLNPKGRIFAKGDFLVTPPESALSASTGFLVRVQDTVTPVPLDLSFSWTPAECATNSKNVIRCKSADKRRQMLLSPIAGSGGQLYRFILRLSRLTITGPFVEPVAVTIVNGPPTLTAGLDRHGIITDCSQRNLGIVCRE